jgi:hypothetical protein
MPRIATRNQYYAIAHSLRTSGIVEWIGDIQKHFNTNNLERVATGQHSKSLYILCDDAGKMPLRRRCSGLRIDTSFCCALLSNSNSLFLNLITFLGIF